jgi:tetratricopeptide (TPR) repeat protein
MMSGNRSRWDNNQRGLYFSREPQKNRDALQGRAGEKPVLNEIIQAKFPGEEAPVVKAEKAVEISRENRGLNEGIRLFRMKRWESALREFQLVDVDKSDTAEQVELAYYMGLCFTKLDRYDDAILFLEQVVTAGNDVLRSYQCRMTLAFIYIKTDRAKMAEYELKRLRNAGFESASMYNALAFAAYSQKRYRHAIDYYEKTLELDKNNATAMNSMGYILADRGFDIMKGLRLCRKAVDIRPQNAAYMDSLGWAYYKCGEMIEARNWLRRAIDFAPQEKEIREHFRLVTGEAV